MSGPDTDPDGLLVIENVLSDRGSRYAVAGAPARDQAAARAHLAALRRRKKIARATHRSWGLLSTAEGPIKDDDGESGAGMVILRMLERAGLHDHVVVVVRWYGGKHLGGDRFRHVQQAVRQYLAARGLDAGLAADGEDT
ncbi:YigZ family protein [Phaeovulum vinaykumarii]|uniref:Uncharacterized protein family UPF0029 n=1 Tax=Phaeovulum vinaykumarii TaxID=407234 RepID=A0A1N7JWA3_9RHOB|nr:YigZ family protein [Phaeovulum vinaykumarii]SIS53635.1 Uncharacterized protein family UPF0029 [Phaeovulum vinaykumarii]SOB91660.1 uncharacterized protein UPF0029 [Phaeovulum vinaykumarii]